MALNIIEAAAIFQKACDQQLLAGATSGWMEDNAGQVKYSGGAEVKIPTITTGGLGNYDREQGYRKGAVSLTYQTKTMTMDRGKQFLLDRIEVDESNFVANATAVMSVFQAEDIIPEVDAYRYSSIYRQAAAAGYSKTYTPSTSDIASTLNKDITAVRDACGAAELVLVMPYTVADYFDNSDKLSKYLNVADFKQGGVNTQVKTYNGIPLIRVPSDRMKTAYEFKTGETEFGFSPTADAKQINWIICPRRAPIAVSKTDNFKIFEPAVVQDADAWKIDYRKFHDLWIKDKQLKAIRVCSEA